MRVCTFRLPGEPQEKARIGLVTGKGVAEASERLTMQGLLDKGPRAWKRLGARSKLMDPREVVLHAPLPRPRKILAAIVNTKAMLGGEDVSMERPRIDMKAPSSVIGPNQRILGPPSGVRPEVELAAVIGRTVSRANLSQSKKSIFGYTVLNDVTSPRDSREDAYEAYRRDAVTGEIRKVKLRGPLFRSKNHDTFCPMGPWIVTTDELADVSNLEMKTLFNGRPIQEGSTSEYIFSPEKIVSYVSTFLSLEPGDVVSCGSVGWTKKALGNLDPTEFVLEGGKGVLELTVEGIGTLRNPVALAKPA